MSVRSYSELDEESPASRAAAAAEALFEAHQDEQRRQRTARVDALERRIGEPLPSCCRW